MAMNLLKQKGVAYQNLQLSSGDAKHNALKQISNQRTFPYVYVGNNLIGGYDDLQASADSG